MDATCAVFRQYVHRDRKQITDVKQDFLCIYFDAQKVFFYFQEKEDLMKEIYQMTKEEVQKRYQTEMGLCSDEAQKRLEQYGRNQLMEQKKKSVGIVFAKQFADLLVIILMIAAVISMFSGNLESTIVILAVIVLNAVLGTVQYVKAEKSLEALKKLSSPHAKVIRDGKKQEIPSEEIVPGDLLILEAGDLAVADGRILESHSLQVNESSLTGESANVEKADEVIPGEAPLGDRKNMVFSGSLVTYGRGIVLVTATGMDTEIGKIASLMNNTKEKRTPLQVSLDGFSRKLAGFILAVSALVLVLEVWQGAEILDALLFAVALAVAAIPEALGSIVTIVQAMGTGKMAREHAIIKDLKAVESLGCVSVICSDKTGTLTQNKMTVQEIYIGGKCLMPQELDVWRQDHRYFLYNAILNNDSCIRDGKTIGDSTESCLLAMAEQIPVFANERAVEHLCSMMPRLAELPFDSERKCMTTEYMVHNVPMIFTKGAVDVLLERITGIADENGVRVITHEDKERIQKQNLLFSQKGMRVLAFAYRECTQTELTEESETQLVFLGLVSMMDPPREESVLAVKEAIGAGIRPVMITGDHKITAVSIAEKIGIFKEGDRAVTGQELKQMGDRELEESIENISVYARVSPEDKIRIVSAWQKKGHITAMTGDGVNDAPALKKADIGIAMGITGTEVAKDAAAMILADDNFATILKAVLNGRNVYRNIQNAILFLLSGNLAAILVVLYCTFGGLHIPFQPVHLLFINLLTDSLPALAIGMEPSDSRLLEQKPRDPKVGIFTAKFSRSLLLYGVLIGAVTLVAFYMGDSISASAASTMAFSTLTLARLFHGFTCRSEDASIVQIGIKSNLWSVAAFAAGTGLLMCVLCIPALHGLFQIAPLGTGQIFTIAGLAFLPTLVIQTGRFFKLK